MNIGGVTVGGDAPIVIQSMTNTDTEDVQATVEQVCRLAEAGSELVRITVNTRAAAEAVPSIVEGMRSRGHATPIVAGTCHKVLRCRFPRTFKKRKEGTPAFSAPFWCWVGTSSRA